MMKPPAQFVKCLRDYDIENIPAKTLKKLQVYIEDERFTFVNICRKSSAAANLCNWCINVDKVAKINKAIKQLRNALAQAEAQLADME